MRVRSIADVASAVRGRRLDRGLSQSELARSIGVSRKWISEFEAGKPTAEFGLVMRVLEELGLSLDLYEETDITESPLTVTRTTLNLDKLLEEHRADE